MTNALPLNTSNLICTKNMTTCCIHFRKSILLDTEKSTPIAYCYVNVSSSLKLMQATKPSRKIKGLQESVVF